MEETKQGEVEEEEKEEMQAQEELVVGATAQEKQEQLKEGEVEKRKKEMVLEHVVIEEPSLKFVAVNQDADLMVVSSGEGFSVYAIDPFKAELRKNLYASGGIGAIEMYYRTNIFVVVGGKTNITGFSANRIRLWDDLKNKFIMELHCGNEILGIRLRREKLIVIFESRINVYFFPEVKLQEQFKTGQNKNGTCAVSQSWDSCVLAYPDLLQGQIQIKRYDQNSTPFSILACEGEDIQLIALNHDGTRVAVASTQGTCVRVFNTRTGEKCHELRRGSESAVIQCITFDPTSSYLAVSSSKGTVHIYALGHQEKEPPKDETKQNNTPPASDTASKTQPAPSSLDYITESVQGLASSVLSKVPTGASVSSYLLPSYFSQEISFVQFHVPSEVRITCCFIPNKVKMIAIIGASGRLWRASFETEGEHHLLIEEANIISCPEVE